MSPPQTVECRVVDTPIDLRDLFDEINPADGAAASFVGTVRRSSGNRDRSAEVIALEYDAYSSMAEKVMKEIAGEALKMGASSVLVRHRVGRLTPGEVAVAIVARSGHRDAAFQTCRYIIEELKKRVPIWKREVFADGSEWVTSTP